MNFNFNSSLVFIFFIYGLSFFSMGISALQQSVPGGSSISIGKHIKYLGYFGIIHGVMEWVIMIRIAQIDTRENLMLLIIAILLNALSFVFLLLFGIKLIEYRGRYYKIVERIPFILFAIWIFAFITTLTVPRTNFLYYLIYDDIAARYFIGFPGGIITAWALIKNARVLQGLPIKNVMQKYYVLATAFASYGILAGLVVEKKAFFPANVINREVFRTTFGLPVELGRAIAAFVITIMFIAIIDLIKWETNEKVALLFEQNIISEERKKMGQELHDVVIQNLFATGMQIENLLISANNDKQAKELSRIKDGLNHTIEQVRGFIKEVSTRSDSIEGLRAKLKELLENYERLTGVPIELNFEISDLVIRDISAVKLTQIYYIIQEAVSNAVKHSKASRIEVSVVPKQKTVAITIKDNGIGFNKNKAISQSSYGITTMSERAITIDSKLFIKSSENGTEVYLTVPRGE